MSKRGENYATLDVTSTVVLTRYHCYCGASPLQCSQTRLSLRAANDDLDRWFVAAMRRRSKHDRSMLPAHHFLLASTR